MRRLRQHGMVAALIGCLAIAANIVVLMSSCLHGARPAAAAGIDDVLGPLTICTSGGAVVGAESDGEGHSKTSGLHCQACTLFAVATLLAAVAMLALAPLVVPLSTLRPASAQLAAVLLGPGGIRSRAPPLTA